MVMIVRGNWNSLQVWGLVCFLPSRIGVEPLHVNYGVLAALTCGTVKESALNFAIVCLGYETHPSERLNSDVSGLKMQD